MPYNSRADMVCLLAEQYNTKSNIKLGGFWSQLQASYMSSHTEELWYSKTVCLWMTIYIYIYIYIRERERYDYNRSRLGLKNLVFTIYLTQIVYIYLNLFIYPFVSFCFDLFIFVLSSRILFMLIICQWNINISLQM